jgi:hypothetical protein
LNDALTASPQSRTQTVTRPEAGPRRNFLRSGLAIALVFLLVVLLRGWKLTEWSMWEDEEGTVYFSQQTDKPFPRFFPIYFVALRAVYDHTGVTVAAGRIFSAAIAVAGIGVLYLCFRRFVTGRVALLAVLLLAVNLGHVFWSQSIRYYNLVVVWQLLSLYAFLVGFERRNTLALILSQAAFVLALLTHFSAVLLAPVFVGYLGLMIVRRERGGAYERRGYLIFAALLVTVLGFFAWKLAQLQGILGGLTISSARDPVHVLTTVAAYFGLPILGLGLLSFFVPPAGMTPRIAIFFRTAGLLPILELVVIAQLNVINVTWYYALFALSMLAVLAAATLLSLYERGFRRTCWFLGVATGLYAAYFLADYYTTMHGDRPRWEEAARYVRQAGGIDPNNPESPRVFSTLPGVVAFYLGVDPSATMGHPFVKPIPETPPAEAPLDDQWYIVEAGHLQAAQTQAWLTRQCRLEAQYEARTGQRDRTVFVYHYIAEEKSN